MTIREDTMNRPNHYMNAHRKALLNKIDTMPDAVFTRSELSQDHSNREQLRLNRALRTFAEQGYIIRLGHGIYAKATAVVFPDGEIKIILQASFETVIMSALDRLGIDWELGEAIQAYNRGETTQVPAAFSIRLRSRFRGQLSAEGRSVIFEGEVNAK